MTEQTTRPAALTRYYVAIDAGDTQGSASAFTEQALYSHPGTGSAPVRSTIRGRAGLVAYLEDRGTPAWHHELDRWHGSALSGLCEGRVVADGGEVIGSFVASVDLTPAGLIERYVAYASFPAAPS